MFSRVLHLTKIIDSNDSKEPKMDKNFWNNDIEKLFPFEFGKFLPPPPRSKLIEGEKYVVKNGGRKFYIYCSLKKS